MNRTQSLWTIGAAVGVWILVANISSAEPPGSHWIRTGQENGITTYKREVPNRPIVDFMGIGVVNATIVRVASVLLEYARATEWVDSLEEARVVRMLGPFEFIEYSRVGTPPIILRDRDFVSRNKIELDLKKQTFILRMVPATDPAVPPTHHVRGAVHGYWKLRSIANGKQTLVIVQMHGDPKGSVAKWLVNSYQSSWPRSTLESLRRQVAKRDIKIMPQIKAVFEGGPFWVAIK